MKNRYALCVEYLGADSVRLHEAMSYFWYRHPTISYRRQFFGNRSHVSPQNFKAESASQASTNDVSSGLLQHMSGRTFADSEVKKLD